MKTLIMTRLLHLFLILCLCSCASTTPINFLCNEEHIEIYVDDEYVGRGLVHYIVPKNQDYVNVSCRQEGLEVYSRNFYVKGKKNQLLELNIPQDYRYSDDKVIKARSR